MEFYVKSWPLAMAFLGIAAVLALLIGIGIGKPRHAAEIPGVFKNADAAIDRFSFVQTSDGEMQWKVEARRARIVDNESKAVLEDLQVTLFREGGTQMILEGDEGVVDTASHNFTLMKREGSIPIHLESGYTIYTNELQWTDQNQEISTAAPVTIHGDGIEITGLGLRGALGTETFTITKNVRAVVTN
ncbi:MAG TPA: LPS export ABC transporter periplasmic protein LptC [Nitrospirales bacterium]|nr:LPS export ABC transporter periplasmic protein LptC [Nitrospirales bacterium]